MASGAAKNKMLEQKRYFRARMTFNHSLMAADGAYKLDYVDSAVQIDETELNSFTIVVVCHTQISGSSQILATQWLSTRKTRQFTALVFHKVVQRRILVAVESLMIALSQLFQRVCQSFFWNIRCELTMLSIELGLLLLGDTMQISRDAN